MHANSNNPVEREKWWWDRKRTLQQEQIFWEEERGVVERLADLSRKNRHLCSKRVGEHCRNRESGLDTNDTKKVK